MFKVETHMEEINDSLLLDSGTTVCVYVNEDGYKAVVKVVGEVQINIFKNDECVDIYYGDTNKLSKELYEAIKSGMVYEDGDFYVDENNWFEIFYFAPDTDYYVDSDVMEGIENTTDEELLEMVQLYLNDYLKNK